eukprot:c7825_g1_i1 orf=401-595(-)
MGLRFQCNSYVTDACQLLLIHPTVHKRMCVFSTHIQSHKLSLKKRKVTQTSANSKYNRAHFSTT